MNRGGGRQRKRNEIATSEAPLRSTDPEESFENSVPRRLVGVRCCRGGQNEERKSTIKWSKHSRALYQGKEKIRSRPALSRNASRGIFVFYTSTIMYSRAVSLLHVCVFFLSILAHIYKTSVSHVCVVLFVFFFLFFVCFIIFLITRPVIVSRPPPTITAIYLK